MSGDSLPAVSEGDATGEVAAIYGEIRETLGLPVVNLIWRHFATIDGGLAWAWGVLAPVYRSAALGAAAGRLLGSLALPPLPAVPDDVLGGAGVSPEERPVLLAILDGYNRGNALNICALASLSATPCAAAAAPRREVPLPRADRSVPPLPELSDLAPPVQALVWRLNALGQPEGDRTLASLYKHLAPWPGALAIAWSLLAPLAGDGRLEAALGATVAAARVEAGALAPLRARRPEPPGAAAVRAAADHFVRRVIGRMVPIGRLLRDALA